MRIWQVNCACGKPVPVAMHQCGADVICPFCKSLFHVPSSVDLNDWPSSTDSSDLIASSSGELIRANSTEIGSRLRKHLLTSLHFRWVPFHVLQHQIIVSAVAMSLAEGLTESQAMKILEDVLPPTETTVSHLNAASGLNSKTILSLATIARKDEAGMWLKQLLFKPFSSGWLGGIHTLITLLLGCFIAFQFLDSSGDVPGRQQHQHFNRGTLLVLLLGVTTGCFAYFFGMGRILFNLFRRKSP